MIYYLEKFQDAYCGTIWVWPAWAGVCVRVWTGEITQPRAAGVRNKWTCSPATRILSTQQWRAPWQTRKTCYGVYNFIYSLPEPLSVFDLCYHTVVISFTNFSSFSKNDVYGIYFRQESLHQDMMAMLFRSKYWVFRPVISSVMISPTSGCCLQPNKILMMLYLW